MYALHAALISLCGTIDGQEDAGVMMPPHAENKGNASGVMQVGEQNGGPGHSKQNAL